MEYDRRKEIINICLDHFIEKGLYETSTRSLSSALQLQNAGVYYYFKTKDEAVVACAEAAAFRLENELIIPAIKEMFEPDVMMKHLKEKAKTMSPTMQFLSQVCSTSKYRGLMDSTLKKLSERYAKYVRMCAEQYHCQETEIEPYVYMCITAFVNYMIFNEESYINPQLKLVENYIQSKLKSKEDE